MRKLTHVYNRVVVSVDMERKNSHTFQDGTTIRLERKYNEFNQRITQPVQGIVISAENIPDGSELLFSHNATHDSNRIFNYTPLSGSDIASDIRYFSIPEADCYAWRDKGGELKPMKDFAFGLRVFKPYTGFLTGIESEILKDVLYMTTGHLKGNVCMTLKACDYQIIFQNEDGREESVIRLRHSEERKYFEREELIGIRHDLTEQVNEGKLIVGLSISDAKPISEIQCSMTPT